MTLSFQEIWERYSIIEKKRAIEIKRLNSSGVYESSWVDIESLSNSNLILKEVCKDINFKLPNESYKLGVITFSNCKFMFNNPYGEMSDEDNPSSIFSGYIRHNSLIRIRDSFVDRYTDPSNPVDVTVTTFEGFIDDKQCSTTFDNKENILATETLGTLLKKYTIRDFATLISTTIEGLVYEIMDRSEFTDFFTVSVSNISAGYNATNFDLSEYDDSDTILDLMQDFSTGHSLFYVKEGVFYYQSLTPLSGVQINFGTAPERKIKLSEFNSGGRYVKDKLYWEGSNAEYLAPVRKYDEAYTFSIKGITALAQQQGLLNAVGSQVAGRKKRFKLTIPFLPILFIQDRVTVERPGIQSPGGFILDVSKLDIGKLLNELGAIIISSDTEWAIKAIKHSKRYQTILTLEEIT